tara:strand:- start:129 stop:2567 length:2439 start_codon:yes stop_codon:yes gene_type:complete
MQIKNKAFLVFFLLIISFFLKTNLSADEFDISAKEIIVDKQNNTVIGTGSVVAIDSENNTIKADKIIYEKSKEVLNAKGSVKIYDIYNNILFTDEAVYDKSNNIITTYKNSKLTLEDGYVLKTNIIYYKIDKKTLSSNQNSIFSDSDGNTIIVDMFQYEIKKNIFSSVGKIKVTDKQKNKYYFKEIYIDTKEKEMIGSDVSVLLDNESFGLSKENEPRFVANDITMSKNKSNISRGVFTVCKNRGKDKCPPWSLRAKKITHDKTKKTIYYDNAVLKFYEVPLFYFPKFFHPDPTVKRQSGFLVPSFTDSTTVGTGISLPYYWAISNNKDMTLTTKTYKNENILFLNEYRQAFRNGFLTLDTSYTEGYKNTTNKKTDGSRNHIFADLKLELGKFKSYVSDLSIRLQRTSNDTYFRVHDIDTALVARSDTDLENEIKYNFRKDNLFLDVSAHVYENLRKDKTSDKYEYVLPNIMFGNTFFTKKFGSINFSSNAEHKNFETNKYTTILTNDFVWNPVNSITKKGFVNTLEGMIRNTNYKARKTSDYKTDNSVNELSGVIGYKSSLPLKKVNQNFSKIFSPNFMLRYAPGHMRDIRGDDVNLRYANLYALNKTSEIEEGLSAILGFDYKINEKDENGNDKEKISLSLGQVFNRKENRDRPSKSSLDQKSSDLVGEFNYNFSEIGQIGYKFSLDHNYENLNYNEVSTTLNFGKVGFNIDYLEERSHVGNEHYVNSGVSLALNDNNKLSFETKKNFKTDSTELYDISYQYKIDCLTAGVVFRREFYKDSDLDEKDTLMFKITFVPFGGLTTPSFIKKQ